MRFKLFISFIAVLIFSTHSDALDSLRIQFDGNKKFIVHRVEAKETLYGISRRYNLKVQQLIDHNKDVVNELKIGQEILVPIVKAVVKPESSLSGNEIFHIIQAKETFYSISRQYNLTIDSLMTMNGLSSTSLSLGDSLIVGFNDFQQEKIIPSEETNSAKTEEIDSTKLSTADSLDIDKYHIVGKSETLFSISKHYNTTVEALKNLNEITNEELSLNQKLLIPESIKQDSLAVKEEPVKIDTVFVTTDNTRFKDRIEKMGNLDKTVQEGFAMKIHRTEDSRKYLALHRTAAIGTIIEVKNQMNDLSIFARVVGKLPETGLNRDVLIRISSAAYEKLRALDAKIPVEIGYIIEND